jgi:hypothetical protein
MFTQNRFTQLTPIHELSELQRQPLNLLVLRASDAKEIIYFGRSRRSTRRRSAWTWGGASHLWLILTTRWAAGATLRQSG